MNRAEKRRLEREANDNRIVGWIQHSSPKQLGRGNGWFGEMDRVYRDVNSKYVVMIRNVETEWGIVQHACMRNVESTDIPWAEKQRIKNMLFGEESTAVEIFPKESELVDEANMYHIWVLPDNFRIPFGI